MAEAKFYTYVHRKASTGEVFYVGKGSGKRYAATQDRSSYWRRIVDKHGVAIEVVAYFFDEAAAFDHERLLIAEYRASGVKLCNLTDGGDGASGNVMSEEARRKISEANKGRKREPFSDATRAKMSAAHLGKKLSPEAIAKTAAAHRGMKRSPETLARMSAALKGKGAGREVSAETRAKIVAINTGRVHTAEARANMSASHKGRKYYPMSEDQKQKILAGQAAYWVRRRAEKAAHAIAAE